MADETTTRKPAAKPRSKAAAKPKPEPEPELSTDEQDTPRVMVFNPAEETATRTVESLERIAEASEQIADTFHDLLMTQVHAEVTRGERRWSNPYRILEHLRGRFGALVDADKRRDR